MRIARVFAHNVIAGQLIELEPMRSYRFEYVPGYDGAPVSLTMPVSGGSFSFEGFPPFFEGVLPEGIMLESLLRDLKIERNDLFSQLMVTGGDLVGAITVLPNE